MHDLRESAKESNAVERVCEDRQLDNAAVVDVVDAACDQRSRWTRHAPTVRTTA
jgi:hypothetical protein